jgi:hypothetical protein
MTANRRLLRSGGAVIMTYTSLLLASACVSSREPAADDRLSRARILDVTRRVADWQLAHVLYEAPLPEGASGVLRKPFTIDDLSRVINERRAARSPA